MCGCCCDDCSCTGGDAARVSLADRKPLTDEPTSLYRFIVVNSINPASIFIRILAQLLAPLAIAAGSPADLLIGLRGFDERPFALDTPCPTVPATCSGATALWTVFQAYILTAAAGPGAANSLPPKVMKVH